MDVKAWKTLLRDLPDDVEVVIEEVHERTAGPDEYDDYAGMGTGEFTSVGARYNATERRVEIDRYC